jgi:hypothetical protein
MSMFISTQSIQAETAYRQERIKRDYGRANGRRLRAKRAEKAQPLHARHALRPTTAA